MTRKQRNERKFTDGPWLVHPVKARVDAMANGKVMPICELLWPTDLRSEEETLANAELIAAAPKMIKALQFLRETQAYKALHGKTPEYIRMRSEAWTMCGWAINAATGE